MAAAPFAGIGPNQRCDHMRQVDPERAQHCEMTGGKKAVKIFLPNATQARFYCNTMQIHFVLTICSSTANRQISARQGDDFAPVPLEL